MGRFPGQGGSSSGRRLWERPWWAPAHPTINQPPIKVRRAWSILGSPASSQPQMHKSFLLLSRTILKKSHSLSPTLHHHMWLNHIIFLHYLPPEVPLCQGGQWPWKPAEVRLDCAFLPKLMAPIKISPGDPFPGCAHQVGSDMD